MEGPPLAAVFAAACASPVAATDALDGRLRALHASTVAGLPFSVTPEELAAGLARVDGLRDALVAGNEVAPEAAAEVALAAALARGDAKAFACFESRYIDGLGAALSRMKLDADALDEVRQAVREKLLLPGEDGAAPRVVAYVGEGRLEGLVRVAATRAALDLVRRERRAVATDVDLLDAATEHDPGLDALKRRAQGVFREVFEAAVRGLDARGRTLLRLHLLGGVTLERLAAMHNVHRATVVRWLAAAREDVLKATRAGMRGRMALTEAELDALMGAVQSRIDLSVERLLRSQEG